MIHRLRMVKPISESYGKSWSFRGRQQARPRWEGPNSSTGAVSAVGTHPQQANNNGKPLDIPQKYQNSQQSMVMNSMSSAMSICWGSLDILVTQMADWCWFSCESAWFGQETVQLGLQVHFDAASEFARQHKHLRLVLGARGKATQMRRAEWSDTTKEQSWKYQNYIELHRIIHLRFRGCPQTGDAAQLRTCCEQGRPHNLTHLDAVGL